MEKELSNEPEHELFSLTKKKNRFLKCSWYNYRLLTSFSGLIAYSPGEEIAKDVSMFADPRTCKSFNLCCFLIENIKNGDLRVVGMGTGKRFEMNFLYFRLMARNESLVVF